MRSRDKKKRCFQVEVLEGRIALSSAPAMAGGPGLGLCQAQDEITTYVPTQATTQIPSIPPLSIFCPLG
jgi:hypothetical protein